MIHFAVFMLIKYNIFLYEKKHEAIVFEYHVKYDLRQYGDKKPATIKSFFEEYTEAKQNNYPDIAWAYNFNCWGVCCTRPALDFNQAFQTHCRIKMGFGTEEHINYYAKVLEETKELYKIYDLIDDAFYGEFCLVRKRKSLHTLREILGEKNFYAGLLPAPVPLWRFELFD